MSTEQISSIDDTPAVQAPAAKTVKGKGASSTASAPTQADAQAGEVVAEAQAPVRRMLTIHASNDETGQNAVEVGVNGVVYQIPRGVPCAVPEEVIGVLENAQISVYKTVNGEAQEHLVPRFAFTVSN